MDAHHVPSLKLYFTVFGILMVGTALTVLRRVLSTSGR